MAGSLLARGFRALELLADNPRGLRLQDVSDRLMVPKSAAHRLLAELTQLGYARQDSSGGYLLTTRLLSLGYGWLGGTGLGDLVQPVLDRLAAETGELVRYAVLEGERLVWLIKAQGARFGLRLDPDQGMEAVLYCTATGQAFLATMDDDAAVAMVMRQGFGTLETEGPNAPSTVRELLATLRLTRQRGYGRTIESSAPGTAAIAIPVRAPGTGTVLGVLSVAGPSVRMTEERMAGLAPRMIACSRELALVFAQHPPQAMAAAETPIGRGSFPPDAPGRSRQARPARAR